MMIMVDISIKIALRQVLVLLQQHVVMTVTVDISIKIALQQVRALARLMMTQQPQVLVLQPLVVMMVTIKIALQQVRAQQLLQEEEVVAQQVLVLQPLVVEQQQVQVAALQVKVFNFFFSILNSVKSDVLSSVEYCT
jgi:hypothetical protein